jgi:hypothetical protein
MFGKSLLSNACVIVDQSCPVTVSVLEPEAAEIVWGSPRSQWIDVTVHREALRTLVRLGAEALERMDASIAADGPPSRAAASG